MENLEVLTRVETLCLRWNMISKIQNVSTLTSLTELDLYDNQAGKFIGSFSKCIMVVINGFSSFMYTHSISYEDSNLQLMQISTQITEMENLETLTNLESLDISFNRLRKIQGLENLAKLRYGHQQIWLSIM